ncbi:MAG TPA: F0F1 ATP synthase subunit delta [Acetivibrio clariflavus]|nr:F0F1 ATP synthase subunit delta [Acetivibrio clariflavus]HPU42291.1 F0F1 ATP synthase subunit delta [Acetivibrio clariflavus]
MAVKKGSNKMPLIEARYAEALVEITEENHSTDKVLDDFSTFVSIFNNSPELEEYLKKPNVQSTAKKKLLDELFMGQVDENFLKFLYLLVDKNRINCIGGILQEYKRMADEKKNVLNLKIISAVPLDDLQIEKIKEKYAGIYKKDKVNAVVNIDRSLIGGIKVQIGDRVEDYSVKSRLDSLKKLLTER